MLMGGEGEEYFPKEEPLEEELETPEENPFKHSLAPIKGRPTNTTFRFTP